MLTNKTEKTFEKIIYVVLLALLCSALSAVIISQVEAATISLMR